MSSASVSGRQGGGNWLSALILRCRVLMALLLPGSVAWGGTVSLGWDAETVPTTVWYNVYYGPASGNYTAELPAGTNVSITIPGLTEGATYYFAVDAYDWTGQDSDLSTEVAYTVPFIPPTITSQPLSQAINAGMTAVFSEAASGTAPFGYQWLENGNAIAGATNAWLYLAHVNDASVGTYSVVISNRAGAVTSAGAVLTVINPPTIKSQPLSQTSYALASAVMGVSASGTAPFTFQWFRNGTNRLRDGGTIAGSATPILAIFGVLPADAGGYTVTVSNTAGCVTSSVATLTVINNRIFSASVAPGMAGQYNGLFYETNVNGAAIITETTSGMLNSCMVTSNRTYSGKFLISGAVYSRAGTFDLTGNDSFVLSRAAQNLSNLTVALHLDWTFGTRQITGTVASVDAGRPWIASVLADQATNGVPLAATNFQAYIPPAPGAPATSPGGYGTIMIRTSATGSATVMGVLADSTMIAEIVPVSKDGNLPLYMNLYNGRGLVEGWIGLAGGTPIGAVTWINLVTTNHYANGFTSTVLLQSAAQ